MKGMYFLRIRETGYNYRLVRVEVEVIQKMMKTKMMKKRIEGEVRKRMNLKLNCRVEGGQY